MKPPPPLRFLALVVGSWACFRIVLLVPDGSSPAPMSATPFKASAAALAGSPSQAHFGPRPARPSRDFPRAALAPPRAAMPRTPAASRSAPAAAAARPAEVLPPPPVALSAAQPVLAALAPERPAGRRWSGSAWLLVRPGSGAALARGGSIGGSQAGARLLYRLDGSLALSGRLYAPLDDRRAAEAALGVEWQPVRTLPVRLLAERRQALGRTGRSAFVLLAHGGVSGRPVAAGLLLDAYGQAGVAGLGRRDPFADGALALSFPVRRNVALAAGLWGAAQPGAARFDAGPSLVLRLPVADRAVRVSADWRFRLAGEAAPASGPALTVASDF